MADVITSWAGIQNGQYPLRLVDNGDGSYSLGVSGGAPAGTLGYSAAPVANPFGTNGIPMNRNAVDTVKYPDTIPFLTTAVEGVPNFGFYDSLLDTVVLQVSGGSGFAVFKTDDGEAAIQLPGASGFKIDSGGNNGTRIVFTYLDNSSTYNIFGYSDDGGINTTFVLGGVTPNGGTSSSIASNGGNIWMMARSDESYLLRSTDNGETWAQVSPTGFVSGNQVYWDGTQFVLVGTATGNLTYLGTSTNGLVWAQVDTSAHDGANASLGNITKVGSTYIITGSNLLVEAIETDFVCLAGTDLDTLTATEIIDGSGAALPTYGLAATTGMAVALSSDGLPYLSEDNGATWAASATPPADNCSSISYHAGSSLFIAVTGTPALSASPDGDVFTDTTVDDLEFYATALLQNQWMKGK